MGRGKLLCQKQIEEFIDFAPKIEERDTERRKNGGEKHKQGGERLRLGEVRKTSRLEIGEEHPRIVMPNLFLIIACLLYTSDAADE